jgi:hypothetical protein
MTDGKDYCGGCGQKLVEGTFATLPDGKMFHADCFRCQHCQQSIQDRFISGPETKFYHSEVSFIIYE